MRTSTTTGATVTRTAGPEALRALAAAGWDDLVGGMSPADPLRRIAWLEVWLREAAAGAQPRALVVERDGVTVGAAALESHRRGGLRVVRHLGQGDAWFHIQPPAIDDAAFAELLAAIAREQGDILMLDGLPAGPETEALLRSTLPGVRLEAAETWRLTIADPPRSVRKRRKEAGRARRRAAERGVTMSVDWTTDWAAIEPRLGDLLDFHAANFPGDGPNLLAGAGARRRFAETAIPALGAEGRARLSEVRGDGRLLAWDLAFVGDGGSAVAYAGAFDRSREDLMMLGWISMLGMVEALAAEGVEVVDFGPGPAPYKDLISRSVPLVRAIAPLSPLGRVALTAHRAAGAGRRLVAGARRPAATVAEDAG